MAAIIGPNIIGHLHGERAVNWAQLDDEYREYAFDLHELALGNRPKDSNDVGPIYVRQALRMKKEGLKLA